MWRLLNVVDTERPWTITGMAFYADEAQDKDVQRGCIRIVFDYLMESRKSE